MSVILEYLQNVYNHLIEKIKARIAVWRERRRYLQLRDDYIERLSQQDAVYSPEFPDVEIAWQAREYLAEVFPNGIKEKVSQMTHEEIVQLFIQLEDRAESILGVEVENVCFYSHSIPPECYYCGFYSHSENKLSINAALLDSQYPEFIEEQVYTIFHELKHARQWLAVKGDKDYGYSEELLRSWAENMMYYVTPQEGDENYRKQPLELDTFGFESLIREKKY